MMFQFDTSYFNLPEKFYSKQNPEKGRKPEKVLFNLALFEELNISIDNEEQVLAILSGNEVQSGSTPFAQAYAGHQFGNFTMLGDGRAIVLGEHITKNQKRFDIQLKGAGATNYSRRGDGKATLKAMLREYLISEAMHHLKISTSRSLAVVKTGNEVFREEVHQGAVLTRVMKSHLRVGTFEYARHFGTIEDLKALTDYTINRLYPEIIEDKKAVETFYLKVIHDQIELVCHWMRVGFIHGVMNTDNTSISSETFDYGPCAFMNQYHPGTVYSSIDRNSRYAFGNQPNILKWNMVRLAEALLPLFDENSDNAIEIAQGLIGEFDSIWHEKYKKMMLSKLGLSADDNNNFILAEELLGLMHKHQLDYTNTFASLSYDIQFENAPFSHPEMQIWLEKWKTTLENSTISFAETKEIMKQNNPVFIPRNHLVEEALNYGANGNMSYFMQFLEVLKTPYSFKKEHYNYILPPETGFETNYQTFCGT
ncbi:MAG TPA: YdiU family protein [Flavobacterium sp.]|nr:YdiU family protein [Flavobacterium sp.]